MPSQPQLNLNELHAAYLKDPLLVDEFASSLRIFVLKTVKSHCRHQSKASYGRVEDAVGDTLLEVWRRLAGFNPEKAQFTTWVTRIVLDNIIDIYRKYSKRQEILLDDAVQSIAPVQRAVKEYIAHLPAKDKAFIQMKLDGLTDEEMSLAYDIPIETLRTRWKRLKKRLKSEPI